MYLKALILVINLFYLNLQAVQVGTIKWEKGKELRWNDYEGKIEINTPVAAISFVGIVYSTVNFSYNKYLLEIDAEFVKNKSAVWMEKASDAILLHEQKHFDLAEIYARKMRRALLLNKLQYNSSNIREEIENIFNLFSDSLSIIHAKYDLETHYSLNWEKQQEWNLAIRQELKELDKYKYPFVTIYLKTE